MYTPLVKLTGDFGNFILGLLSGVQIFDGPMNNSSCFKNSSALTYDNTRILDVIRNITAENVVKNLRLVLDLYETLLVDARPVAKACNETVLVFQAVLLRVRDTLTEPDYVSELATNPVLNLYDLKVLGNGVVQSLQQKNFTQAGSLLGKAVKLGFLTKY